MEFEFPDSQYSTFCVVLCCLFFILTHFETISHLQKTCKNTLSPSFVLHTHETVINIRKLIPIPFPSCIPIIYINWNSPVRKSCPLASVYPIISVDLQMIILFYGLYPLLSLYCKNCPRIVIKSTLKLSPVSFAHAFFFFFLNSGKNT